MGKVVYCGCCGREIYDYNYLFDVCMKCGKTMCYLCVGNNNRDICTDCEDGFR